MAVGGQGVVIEAGLVAGSLVVLVDRRHDRVLHLLDALGERLVRVRVRVRVRVGERLHAVASRSK